MIILTSEDWSEIFYALESKSLAVGQGYMVRRCSGCRRQMDRAFR